MLVPTDDCNADKQEYGYTGCKNCRYNITKHPLLCGVVDCGWVEREAGWVEGEAGWVDVKQESVLVGLWRIPFACGSKKISSQCFPIPYLLMLWVHCPIRSKWARNICVRLRASVAIRRCSFVKKVI